MAKNILSLFFCVLTAGIFMLTCDTCPADTLSQAKAKFYHANAYYSEAEYDKAIDTYREALDLGFESGALYYNLGNSYFKKGRLGEAIFNYERAMRLMPRDSDLRSNYEYAKSLIKGGVTEAKVRWYRTVFDRMFSWFTVDGLTFSLALLFTGILLVILAGAYIPAIRKYQLSVPAVLFIVFAIFFAALCEKASAIGREAVVIAEKTDAKFEPFDSATTYFTLYEGAKVTIVSPKESWYKVERSDRKTGWVPKKSLEVF